jgi:hypothetical protein
VGQIVEVAGPREERLAEAARLLVARRGDGLRVEELGDPAEFHGDDYSEGILLPGRDAILTGPTFAEWLDSAYPQVTAA